MRHKTVASVLRHVSRVVDHAWVQGADLVSIFVTEFLSKVKLPEDGQTSATTKGGKTQTWIQSEDLLKEEWGPWARNPFMSYSSLCSFIKCCFLRALFPDGRARTSWTGKVSSTETLFCELAKHLATRYEKWTGKPLLTLCASSPAPGAAAEGTGAPADGGSPRRSQRRATAASAARALRARPASRVVDSVSEECAGGVGRVAHTGGVTSCDLGPVEMGSHGVVPYSSFLYAAAEQFRDSWLEHLLGTPSIYKGQREAVRALLGRFVFRKGETLDDAEAREPRSEYPERGRSPGRHQVQKRGRPRTPRPERSGDAGKRQSKRVKPTSRGDGQSPAAAAPDAGAPEASDVETGSSGESPAARVDLPVKAVAEKLWPDPKGRGGAGRPLCHCDRSKVEDRINEAIKVIQDELKIRDASLIDELRESFKRLVKVSALVPWDKWGLKEWQWAKEPPRLRERHKWGDSTMYAFGALPFVAEVASVCSAFNKELDDYKERLGYEKPVRCPAARRPRKQAGGSSPPSRLEASRRKGGGETRKGARGHSFPKPCRVRLPHILPGDRPPSLILRDRTLRRVLGWLKRARSKLPGKAKLTGIGKMPFRKVWTHLFNRKATFARGGQFRKEGEKAKWVCNMTGHTDGQALSVCFVRLVPAGTAAGAEEAVSSAALRFHGSRRSTPGGRRR